MKNEINEWEMDWWWLDVVEGDISEEEKSEAEWLLKKSPAAKAKYRSWRGFRNQIKGADNVSRVEWDTQFFEKLNEKIMSKIETQFPEERSRP